jgi:hypothetical protein
MRRPPLFSTRFKANPDATSPASPLEGGVQVTSPFQDAAAANASHASANNTATNPDPPTPTRGGRARQDGARGAARSLSRLMSGAIADLSYLADPDGAVEGGDAPDDGDAPSSPPPTTSGPVSFSPLAAAAEKPRPRPLERATLERATAATAATGDAPTSCHHHHFPTQKSVFVACLVTVVLAAFWLGSAPFTFYRLYTLAASILLPARWVAYRKDGAHYYLLDLCYFGNVLTLYSIWWAPASLHARHAAFAFGAGPLLWAIPAFRNAAVFHDADKMTSLFIHAGPALVAWAGRWRPGPLVGLAPTAAAAAAARAVAAKVGLGGGWGHAAPRPSAPWWSWRSPLHALAVTLPAGWESASPRDLLAAAAPIYLAWAVPYSLFLFVFAAKRIRARGYATLYGYLTRSPEGAVTRMVAGFPPAARPAAFMGAHALATAASVALASFLWDSYVLHTGALIAAVGVSAFNAASFYEYLINKAARAGQCVL